MTWLTIKGPNVATAITLLEELCRSAELSLRLWRRPIILRERGSEALPQPEPHRDAARPPDDADHDDDSRPVFPDADGQPSDSEPGPDGSGVAAFL